MFITHLPMIIHLIMDSIPSHEIVTPVSGIA